MMIFKLNNLCYNEEISEITDEYKAKKCVDGFVDLLHKLREAGILEQIESDIKINNINIGSNYHVYDWLNDSDVKREHKSFLKTILNKHNKDIFDNDSTSDFCVDIQGKKYCSHVLKRATEDEDYVISINTTSVFNVAEINGTYIFADEELNDLRGEERVIQNIFDTSKIEQLKASSKNELYSNINSGYDLWDRRKEAFPNLIFCDQTKIQICENHGKSHIISVIKRLEILNKYYDNNFKFDIKLLGFNARTESETVIKTPKLKECRKFKKPDNTEEYFFEHISFTGDFKGRIYFKADDNSHKIYIGYIGKHLPTAKY